MSHFRFFKNTQNWTIFNQSLNVARFARKVEWDFFCDFQTPWVIGWFDQGNQTYAIRPCCSLQDCFLDPLLVVNVRFKRLIHLSWWCMPKDLLWKRKLGVLTALRVHRVIGHGSITVRYWPCMWNSDLISCSLSFRSGFPWVTHKKRKFHRTQKNKAPEGNPLDIQTTSEDRENERIAQLQLAFLRLLLDPLTWIWIFFKINNFAYSYCLKITQNVAFEFFNFGIFHQFLFL